MSLLKVRTLFKTGGDWKVAQKYIDPFSVREVSAMDLTHSLEEIVEQTALKREHKYCQVVLAHATLTLIESEEEFVNRLNKARANTNPQLLKG